MLVYFCACQGIPSFSYPLHIHNLTIYGNVVSFWALSLPCIARQKCNQPNIPVLRKQERLLCSFYGHLAKRQKTHTQINSELYSILPWNLKLQTKRTSAQVRKEYWKEYAVLSFVFQTAFGCGEDPANSLATLISEKGKYGFLLSRTSLIREKSRDSTK